MKNHNLGLKRSLIRVITTFTQAAQQIFHGIFAKDSHSFWSSADWLAIGRQSQILQTGSSCQSLISHARTTWWPDLTSLATPQPPESRAARTNDSVKTWRWDWCLQNWRLVLCVSDLRNHAYFPLRINELRKIKIG